MEPQVDLGNVIARLGTKIGELETRNALLIAQVEAYQAQETTTESIDKKEE
ncbi:hypothetical protein [Limosilactobacillus gorillae]|uniref:hypothetical protein n=1 Tax=Limosilactobacillus gorillae TaxID=1450649 RepID=UPI000A81BF92|nr:hypothetical protein [Limosilactobacillus gorillae]